MAILDIITYPDPRLLEPSEPVETIDDTIRQLIEDMVETMFDAPGSGLAAIQVGVNKQIIVVNTTATEEEPSWYALINPRITEKDGYFLSEDEGCLSVPELRANVKRASKIKVEALDVEGKPVSMDVDGFHAVILQHEIDHVNGVLFVDYLSALKRNMYKKKIKKLMKQ